MKNGLDYGLSLLVGDTRTVQISEKERRAASLTVASHSKDAADCKDLLKVLGLLEEHS